MTVNQSPDRIIIVDGIEYLYFGGTNYLGITTHPDFQKILFESIQKWGTSYGSSRNSNVKLSIYTTAEKLLAKNNRSEAALTVSSGMLAGKLTLEYLAKITDQLFHLPNTHQALRHPSSLPLVENDILNPKLFDKNNSKIALLADAIPLLEVFPIDLSILNQIPTEKQITLVLDESHTIGLPENSAENVLPQETLPNIYRKIGIASLGKAIGLSGGLITGDVEFIDAIKKQNSFVAASGMNPVFLETYVNAQELYQSQKQKLEQNINFFSNHFKNNEAYFTFNKNYPVIYYESDTISARLLNNKIVTTSFSYPTTSGKLCRIVITANHTQADLERLIDLLNTFYNFQ